MAGGYGIGWREGIWKIGFSSKYVIAKRRNRREWIVFEIESGLYQFVNQSIKPANL